MAGNSKLPKFEISEHTRAVFERLSSSMESEGMKRLAESLSSPMESERLQQFAETRRFFVRLREQQQAEGDRRHAPQQKRRSKPRKPKAGSKMALAIDRLTALYPDGVKGVGLKIARRATAQQFSDRTLRRALDWLKANS